MSRHTGAVIGAERCEHLIGPDDRSPSRSRALNGRVLLVRARGGEDLIHHRSDSVSARAKDCSHSRVTRSKPKRWRSLKSGQEPSAACSPAALKNTSSA